MKSVRGKIVLVATFSLVALFFLVLSREVSNDSFCVTEQSYPVASPVDDGKMASVLPVEIKAAPWQWQFLPSMSGYLVDHERPVNGVAMGYILPQKEINGFSMALIHAYNAKKNGFSMSLLEYSGNSSGLAIFLAGGVQHNRGVLMGLWNMTEHNHGVQLGLVNQEERNLLMEYDMKPEYKEKKFGVQAGVYNYSDSPGIQFGLWNTNPNSWIKHFPLFNICF